MSDMSKSKLKEEILKIVKGADLEKISSKKIRLEIQEKFGINLLERKKEVDQLVMEAIDDIEKEESDRDDEKDDDDESEGGQEDESEEEEEKKKPVKRAAAPKPKKKPAKKRAKDGSGSDSDFEPKKKKAPGKSNAFTAPMKLTEELQDIVGDDNVPRHEVVKQMWAYIKENKLQDPNNKQWIICDEKLSKIVPEERFKGFGMTKYLKNHMTKI